MEEGRAEVKSQKSEVGGPRSEVRGPKSAWKKLKARNVEMLKRREFREWTQTEAGRCDETSAVTKLQHPSRRKFRMTSFDYEFLEPSRIPHRRPEAHRAEFKLQIPKSESQRKSKPTNHSSECRPPGLGRCGKHPYRRRVGFAELVPPFAIVRRAQSLAKHFPPRDEIRDNR